MGQCADFERHEVAERFDIARGACPMSDRGGREAAHSKCMTSVPVPLAAVTVR